MTACTQPDRCGHPQDGPGHPRKGWLQLKTAGIPRTTWWCSPTCLTHHLITLITPTPAAAAPRPVEPRHDVAACPACINRHDRGHRCPTCGSAPQLPQLVAVPKPRLLDHAYRRTHAEEEPA